MIVDLAAEEAALVGRRQPYARVTVVWSASPVSAKPGDAALVTPDGALRGWVGGSCSEPVVVRQAVEAISEGMPRLVRLDPPDAPAPARAGVVVAPVSCASGGSVEVFVEPKLPPAHLVVVGRSPMVRVLATIAAAVGFDVAVVERDGADAAISPDWLPADWAVSPQRLSVVGELDLDKAGVGPDSFVVVATMGRYDEDAVEAALATGARYVALVASARRAAAVAQTLRRGGVAEEDLARLRPRAGLDLGALPHPEIAVAILAEIVAEKARPKPAPSAPQQPAAQAVDPVCGMTVDAAHAADSTQHAGVTYWFCASGCRRRFEADPDSFLAPAKES